MRPLFAALAVTLVLGWIGHQTRRQYPLVATAFFTMSGMLLVLGVVVFFGLN